MTDNPAEQQQYRTRIPAEHLVGFLRFLTDIPDREPDPDNELTDRFTRAIVATLEGDPTNELALLGVAMMGADDLTDPNVSRLYAAWAAERLLAS